MSFFTYAGFARFAILRGHYRLWRVARILGGPSLAPADLLADAAASPNDTIWDSVFSLYKDMLQPEWVAGALYRSVERDNLRLMQSLLQMSARFKADIDTDHLMACMARHGAENCWLFVLCERGFALAFDRQDALVDAAIAGRSERILTSLLFDDGLAFEFRQRISSKLELDREVEGRNVNYIMNVLRKAEWLKPSDYGTVQTFAMQIKSGYIADYVDERIREARDRWQALERRRAVETGVVVPLRRVA